MRPIRKGKGGAMQRLLGLDLAITAESRACLTDGGGKVLCERWFHLTRSDLEALHEAATEGMERGEVLVMVMEPTGVSWVAPASFFRSRGALVHLVPPEQSGPSALLRQTREE